MFHLSENQGVLLTSLTSMEEVMTYFGLLWCLTLQSLLSVVAHNACVL